MRTDWKQYLNDNTERWNPYENVLTVDNVGSLQAKWIYDTGGSVESSPAVANGMVYIGSTSSNLFALEASTGTALWNYASGWVWSSPAVVNGVVYFGSFDNNVYALNANTGAKLWSYPTRGIVWSSPAVANGVVYCGSSDDNL